MNSSANRSAGNRPIISLAKVTVIIDGQAAEHSAYVKEYKAYREGSYYWMIGYDVRVRVGDLGVLREGGPIRPDLPHAIGATVWISLGDVKTAKDAIFAYIRQRMELQRVWLENMVKAVESINQEDFKILHAKGKQHE